MSSTSEENQNRLILLTSPGPLSKIASSKLALLCWQKHLENRGGSSRFVKIKTTISVSDVFKIPLPKRIKKSIDAQIELLKWKLFTWSQFHEFNVFDTLRDSVFLNYLDCVVLQSNGSKICYKSTAKNLLASDRLNVVEKYSLACTYCFKDDIKRLWPLMSNQYSPRSPATNYWNNVNRNMAVELPTFQFTKNCWYLPNQLEYWIIAGGRILIAESELLSLDPKNEMYLDCILFLLSNSGTTGQNELIKAFPVTLLKVLAFQDEESSFRALQFWHHVKDYITGLEFFFMIESLCEGAFGISRKVSGYVAVLLDEIWMTASDHQRNVVVNNELFPGIFFNSLDFRSIDMRNYGRDMAFYLHILAGFGFKDREKLWRKHWRRFVSMATVSDLSNLLKTCLRNDDEAAKFIKFYMANYGMLEKELKRFVKIGKYQELREYLTFFYPNEESVRETIQKILESLLKDDLTIWVSSEFQRGMTYKYTCGFSLYSNQCNQFNDLIDDSFPSKPSAQKFKKEFILRYVDLKQNDLHCRIILEEIRSMAEAFFSSDQRCLIEMKIIICGLCCSFLTAKPETEWNIESATIQEWKAFVKWCGCKEVPFLMNGTKCDTLEPSSEKVEKVEESRKSRRFKALRNFFSKVKKLF